VSPENAVLQAASGKVVFRFHARDLHLVLGPVKDGKPVRFKVTLDGTPPGEDHGSDADANGVGTVEEHRLYQLIRQKGAVEDRTRSSSSIPACRHSRLRSVSVEGGVSYVESQKFSLQFPCDFYRDGFNHVARKPDRSKGQVIG